MNIFCCNGSALASIDLILPSRQIISRGTDPNIVLIGGILVIY